MQKKIKFDLSILKSLFLIFLVIINSGYMLQVSDSPLKLKIQYFTAFVFMILLFDYFIIKKNIFVKNKIQTKLLIIVLSCLLTMMVNLETYRSYVSFLSIVFIAFYIVTQYENEVVANTFVNVTILLSIISLFYLFIIKFWGIPHTSSTITAGITINQYYDYKLFFYPKLFVSGIGRNSSVFWEPGLFASILIFAMMLETIYKEKISTLKMIVLIVTLFTTRSTGGIILLLPIFLLFLDRRIQNKFLRIFIPIVLWLLVIFVLFFQNEILLFLVKSSPKIFSKLIESGSTKSTRLMSPILNFKIFQKFPIFGAGLVEGTKLYVENKRAFQIDSQTSTSFAMLAYFGIFGALYSYWWCSGILKNKNQSNLQKITLLIIVFIILNKEPHLSIMSTWIIFFMYQKEFFNQILPNRRGKFRN
ncbi:O-antigen ligase family protein [Streptococcus porcinus]|uniref:Conserved domain protein n=1 Tax=Streptococcus porcinus str. Jelinkova 176 TaxID=873448 RepID=A0ABN0CX01_STRPO|nr:O-antigen ligase family protein [Streptococcus porcinus]EGJ27744.1 conserved domain protein [Streptococcus porcinus str. Jelinkova 176]SQG43880.1 Uncharacterised protein [Streptococcus porcinus]